MGRSVQAALDARGHTVAAMVGSHENAGGAALVPARLTGVDVALEFTTPATAPANIARLLAAGVPVVSGTTGWEDQLPSLAALARARLGALLVDANFSVGVHVMLHAARVMAEAFQPRPEFEGQIVEAHHRQKRDAPSGTALSLQRAAREAGGREVPVTSIRIGAVPGTHELRYEGPYESLSLEHVARDRSVFGAGAVLAAEWLVGRTGVFTFEDVLFGRRA
jgi:4-hydroxy-tetrahydrodipicolinate reductase